MDELPTDPTAHAVAILELEARAHAAELMLAAIMGNTRAATETVKSLAGMVDSMAIASMLTDSQIALVRKSMERTVEAAENYQKTMAGPSGRALLQSVWMWLRRVIGGLRRKAG